MDHVQGLSRKQVTLFPQALDDYISQENPVRFIDAFVDGNHRFDAVFVDLFYLGRLIRRGGVVILDDYNLPGIRRAASFFVTNLGWTMEDTVDNHMVVLRTTTSPDTRDFRFFAEF